MMLMCAVLAAGAAQAQAQAQNEYEAAMAKAATPGPQHQFLASMCGTWDLTVKSWNQPGQEPSTQKGRCVSHMVLGGRYGIDEIKMEGGEFPLEGMGLNGYDNVKGEYFSLWVDTMGTGHMVVRGQMDAEGKVMTMTASFVDPVSKTEMQMRTVTTYHSPDHYVSEFFLRMPDGSELKNMEMTGQRVK